MRIILHFVKGKVRSSLSQLALESGALKISNIAEFIIKIAKLGWIGL